MKLFSRNFVLFLKFFVNILKNEQNHLKNARFCDIVFKASQNKGEL